MDGEWLSAGLIDRQNQQLHVYRADGSTTLLTDFDGVASGEDVLPGFELDLQELK